jgi:hypothetical protein
VQPPSSGWKRNTLHLQGGKVNILLTSIWYKTCRRCWEVHVDKISFKKIPKRDLNILKKGEIIYDIL